MHSIGPSFRRLCTRGVTQRLHRRTQSFLRANSNESKHGWGCSGGGLYGLAFSFVILVLFFLSSTGSAGLSICFLFMGACSFPVVVTALVIWFSVGFLLLLTRVWLRDIVFIGSIERKIDSR